MDGAGRVLADALGRRAGFACMDQETFNRLLSKGIVMIARSGGQAARFLRAQ